MSGEIDRRRVQEFARKLFGLYTSGMLTLMVELGHQTGLFDALATGAATSAEVASRTGLNERYVREWLGAMATGGIVEYDPNAERFTLPAEHAMCLTGPSSRNLASNSEVVRMLARHVPAVARCFREGGGVPYADFRPDFTSYQDAAWRRIYDGLLVKGFIPAAKGLAERLRQGIRVADVGCGTGHAVNLMAYEYPRSEFVGYDIADDAIAAARGEAEALGLTNTTFELCDAAAFSPERPFDLVTTFDSVHDQRDPVTVLRRIAGALAPGGLYFMMEPKASTRLEENIGNPFAPYIYAMSVLHCMTVSLAEGGAGLGTAWGEDAARRLLADAGFTSVEVVDAPGPQNLIYLCRRGPARRDQRSAMP